MTSIELPSPTAALEALVLPELDRVDLVMVRLPFVAPFGTSVHVVPERVLKRTIRAERLRESTGPTPGCEPAPAYNEQARRFPEICGQSGCLPHQSHFREFPSRR